ncbi:MAG: vanadium-dependent haloperoxidase [Bacteroidota bacterium]
MSRRRRNAHATRELAAEIAHNRIHPTHLENNDEHRFRHCPKTAAEHKNHKGTPLGIEKESTYLNSFTKGLPHNPVTGLVNNPKHYQLFVRAIDSGDFRDFRDTPLGFENNCNGMHYVPHWYSGKAQEIDAAIKGQLPKTAKTEGGLSVRAWESQSAGLAFDLQGPDAQAVTMPPAPEIGSDELTAEMGEVYAQALLRDIPFKNMSAGVTGLGVKDQHTPSAKKYRDILEAHLDDVERVSELTKLLGELPWFSDGPTNKKKLTPAEMARRRIHKPTPGTAFSGITFGDDVGPYLSQFLLAGDSGRNQRGAGSTERKAADGRITYGAIDIDQRVRIATTGLDYMTSWEEWLDVQNAADLRGYESYEDNPPRRFIFTPRDLATYVHYDARYEAYRNAGIVMLNLNIPFDPGIPFQDADNMDHQQGFAHFGGPHILSLVTEVATRALKAVRFQKYNVHRRCRPEVLAARLEKAKLFEDVAPELGVMRDQLGAIITEIETHNTAQNSSKPAAERGATALLPMAFCEGSPMHPAYGAGHATVAGACVTILKAFFDHRQPLCLIDPSDRSAREASKVLKHKDVLPHAEYKLKSSNLAFISVDEGRKLDVIPVFGKDGKLAHLTVEGELNKLASNISVGRDWAGVHYFTDYYESILMGEEIAIAILEEQKETFGENFSMTLPKFDGTTIRI